MRTNDLRKILRNTPRFVAVFKITKMSDEHIAAICLGRPKSVTRRIANLLQVGTLVTQESRFRSANWFAHSKIDGYLHINPHCLTFVEYRKVS